jgi:hypothetical protein
VSPINFFVLYESDEAEDYMLALCAQVTWTGHSDTLAMI